MKFSTRLSKIVFLLFFITSLSTQGWSQAEIRVNIFYDMDGDGINSPDPNCGDAVYEDDAVQLQLYQEGTGLIGYFNYFDFNTMYIENVPAGSGYYIRSEQDVYSFTVAHADGSTTDDIDEGLDSDFEQVSQFIYETPRFEIVGSETKENIGLGVYFDNKISGFLWMQDNDFDANLDNNDKYPPSGVRIDLIRNGAIEASTQTDANSYYAFDGLVYGDYQVVIPESEFGPNGQLSGLQALTTVAPVSTDVTSTVNNGGSQDGGSATSYFFLANCDLAYYGLEYKANFGFNTTEQCVLPFNSSSFSSSCGAAEPICDISQLDGECIKLTEAPTESGTDCFAFAGEYHVAYAQFVNWPGNYLIDLKAIGCYGNRVEGMLNIEIYESCDIKLTCERALRDESIIIDPDDLEIGKTYTIKAFTASTDLCDLEIAVFGTVDNDAISTADFIIQNLSTGMDSIQEAIVGDTIRFLRSTPNHFDFTWSIEPPDASFDVLNSTSSSPDGTFKSDDPYLDVVFLESQDYIIGSKVSFCDGNLAWSNKTLSIVGGTQGRAEICAYADENANGMRDSGETLLNNANLTMNGIVRSTGLTGCTSVVVDSGLYTAVIDIPYGEWESNSINLTFQIDAGVTKRIEVPFVPKSEEEDQLDVSITSERFRCDTRRNLFPVVINYSEHPISGELLVEVDPIMSDVQYTETPVTVVNNAYLFRFTDLGPGQSYQPILNVDLPGPVDIGRDVEVKATVYGPGNVQLDEATYSDTFFCSYDPNDKQVQPLRRNYDENYLLPGEVLDYTIRFQNTGNDTAYQVRIEDELDANLDASTLMLIHSTHHVSMERSGRSLTLLFENIYLPDSTTNEAASQGQVTFQVKPKADAILPVSIENTANIFFDANPPITTNTVSSLLVEKLPCQDIFNDLGHQDLCQGDTYNLGPIPITVSGTYNYKFGQTNNSCDSTVQVEVEFHEQQEAEQIDVNICMGSAYEVGGTTLTEEGSHTINLGPNQFGCDSLAIFNLSFLPEQFTDLGQVSICNGETYEVNNVTLNQSGDFQFTSIASNGCDSTIQISLVIEEEIIENLGEVSICNGETYEVNNVALNQSGDFQFTSIASNGCDSTVQISLVVEDEIIENLGSYTICEGDQIVINEQTYYEEGSYSDSYTSSTGCDSTIIFDIEWITRLVVDLGSVEICPGDTLYGQVFTESDTYSWTETAVSTGCDSTTQVDVIVLEEDDPNCLPTAIDETSIATSKVYPNPVSDRLSISCEGLDHYTIYGYDGKQVAKGKDSQVDVSFFDRGMYLIELVDIAGRRQMHLFAKY